MKLGPITIQWSKTVEAERQEQEHKDNVRNKMVGLLLNQNERHKAELHRWGISEGIDKKTG